MSDYDPTEFITVCEAILADGEISSDELYTLAEWLNEHREACFHWPGNLLVKPLQDAWADGKLTKAEMRQIGRILIRILKEWAKMQAEASAELAADYASVLSDGFDLSQPTLPSIPFVFRVKSQTEPRVFYDVDLSGPTCSCPDWHSTRAKLPRLHLSRCCKHILQAFGQCEPDGGWPGWLGAFLDSTFAPHPKQHWFVLRVGSGWALASTAPTGWANVYVEDCGSFDRFGYNVVENRWAYGLEPTEGARICRAILAVAKQ